MHPHLQAISESSLKKNLPFMKSGLTVRVHQRIKEGAKERIQVFEGLVIYCKGGKGIDSMFTVRKIVDGIGVEKSFPLHSPNIAKIEVVKESKVRRSKLYYMRGRSGKATRLKGKRIEGGLYIPTSANEPEPEEAPPAESADPEAVQSQEQSAPPAAEEAPEEAPAPEEVGLETPAAQPVKDESAEAPAPEEEAKE
jgi:large subunit ribosomal protein L19